MNLYSYRLAYLFGPVIELSCIIRIIRSNRRKEPHVLDYWSRSRLEKKGAGAVQKKFESRELQILCGTCCCWRWWVKVRALQKLFTTVWRPAYFMEPTPLLPHPGHWGIGRVALYVIQRYDHWQLLLFNTIGHGLLYVIRKFQLRLKSTPSVGLNPNSPCRSQDPYTLSTELPCSTCTGS